MGHAERRQGASGYARASILADNPIGYWRLDETAGAASVADASGSGHVGIASSGVNFGQSGPMADGHTTALFDGSTGAVEVPHATSMNAEALTWEAWVNVPAIAGSFRRVLGKGGTNDVFSLWVEPNSTQSNPVTHDEQQTAVGDVAGHHRRCRLGTRGVHLRRHRLACLRQWRRSDVRACHRHAALEHRPAHLRT